MEQATQLFAAVSLLVIGLSHLFQPTAWVERAWLFRAGGVFAMILSGYCWWLRFWY